MGNKKNNQRMKIKTRPDLRSKDPRALVLLFLIFIARAPRDGWTAPYLFTNITHTKNDNKKGKIRGEKEASAGVKAGVSRRSRRNEKRTTGVSLFDYERDGRESRHAHAHNHCAY